MSQKTGIPLSIKLLVLFIGVPLIEMLLLMKIYSWTSLIFTVLLVFVSGIIGAAMARSQGLKVWNQAHRELRGGKFPADSLIDGIIILIGGALLLTPGVLTDVVGFSTLIPQTRAFWRLLGKIYFAGKVAKSFQSAQQGGVGGFKFYNFSAGGPRPAQSREQESPVESVDGGRSSGSVPKGSPFDDQSPFAKKPSSSH